MALSCRAPQDGENRKRADQLEPAQTLRMLAKLTREGTLDHDDIRAARSAGASSEQIEDALAVCFAFNATTRLANAFGFELLSPEGFQAGAKYLLKRGYR